MPQKQFNKNHYYRYVSYDDYASALKSVRKSTKNKKAELDLLELFFGDDVSVCQGKPFDNTSDLIFLEFEFIKKTHKSKFIKKTYQTSDAEEALIPLGIHHPDCYRGAIFEDDIKIHAVWINNEYIDKEIYLPSDVRIRNYDEIILDGQNYYWLRY